MELTEELVKRRSKHFDLACVTLLDLSAAGIERLAHLDKCVNVLEINLQNNALRSVDGLPSLASLRLLNLSNNNLASIDNLLACPAVEELSFAFPQLRRLQLQDNPVSTRGDLADLVRTALPNLLLLNGEAVALFNTTPPVSLDVDKFVEQETRRIDELLQQCTSTLEIETARVLKALNVASVS